MLAKCKECQKDVSTEAVTCPHCGYPLADGTKCDDCDKGIPVHVEKCPHCGFSIQEEGMRRIVFWLRLILIAICIPTVILSIKGCSANM